MCYATLHNLISNLKHDIIIISQNKSDHIMSEHSKARGSLTCGELKVWSLDNGIHGTSLLAEATVDALGHVDVVSLYIYMMLNV